MIDANTFVSIGASCLECMITDRGGLAPYVQQKDGRIWQASGFSALPLSYPAIGGRGWIRTNDLSIISG